jgi:catalase
MQQGAAIQWVMDAYGHLKAIGATGEAGKLLDKAGVVADEGVTGLVKAFIKAATTRIWAREGLLRNLA